MWILFAALAGSPTPPRLGVGLVLQGARPGLIVDFVHPFVQKSGKKGRSWTHSVAPTVSGWVHPSNYIPLQAHLLYTLQHRRKLLFEMSTGPGVTYVMNARPTFRVDGNELERVPLAGRAVFSPGFALGLGAAGERRDFLVRGRVNAWTGWQHSIAVSWNLEVMLRFGGRP